MHRMYFTGALIIALLITSIGCQHDEPAAQKRVYRLEMVGPAQVVQLYADGFDKLSTKEKIFSYYLYLASIAARDIAVDQHHRNALEIRDVFEEIYKHPTGIDADVRAKITTYLKLFWINNGPYDALTAEKFMPECTYEELVAAAQAARDAGAQFDLGGETLEKKLEHLRPILFDPSVDPILTNKSPGHDWIRGSAVNFYGPGISYAEVERWAKAGNEKNALNSTIVKERGRLVEKVWRAGGDGVPPGMYANKLNATISYLEQAIPYAASEYQAETIRKLVRYYRTGDLEDFRQFNIHWVNDSSTVDFIHGFIEVYLDPRGQKAEFEALIYYADPDQTTMMRELAKYAQYFEDKAPWRDEFKKQIDRSPIANVINVIVGTGGTGPIPPVGINLPNEQAIREQHGSKSVLLANVQGGVEKSSGQSLLREFAWDEEEIAMEEMYGSLANNLHTAMHEVIGHGSGKAGEKLGGKDPADFLPGYYNTLEEARADLVSMYNAWDPKFVDMGIAKDEAEARKIGETLFRTRLRVGLNQLRRISPTATQLEQDHLKNRQLIAQWLIANSEGVRVEKRNGKTYYRVVDFDVAREDAGKLLAEVMRIKAEGDLAAAKNLIDTYGLKVDPLLRDEVQSRVKDLNLPKYTAFVMPKLEAVSDPTAKIVDVKVSYPMDFTAQMLEWSAFTKPFRRGTTGGVAGAAQ
jgi:dipeptidyl-peptidase-3